MKILKFYADWCKPCKILDENLKRLEAEYTSINIDDNEDLVDKYKIKSIPTLIKLDDDNNIISTEVGLLDINELKKWIDK